MQKHSVNEEQYLELLNSELKMDARYTEGMKIIAVPQGSSGGNLSGYRWEGPDNVMQALVSKIVSTVNEQYELRVTYRDIEK